MDNQIKRLSKADILGAADLKTVDVSVPEWGGVVTLKTMTGAERDEFEASLSSSTDAKMVDGKAVSVKVDLRGLKVRLLSLTIVDAEGALLFSKADVADLLEKNGGVIDRLFQECQKLNGMGNEAVNDLIKN